MIPLWRLISVTNSVQLKEPDDDALKNRLQCTHVLYDPGVKCTGCLAVHYRSGHSVLYIYISVCGYCTVHLGSMSRPW